ncbi:MAG: LysE family transporter [Fretibacterium sp.]|nr:LysE family transporter [Fretibacterium sp.]
MPLKALLLFALSGLYTPGPNNIMAMNSARQAGLLRSLPFYYGMSSGFAFITFLTALFNVALEKILPQAQPVLGGLGALYMLYLAVKPFLPHSPSPTPADDLKELHSYREGFLLQFLNPKVMLFSLTLMSGFIIPHVRSTPLLLLISLIVGAFGLSSQLLWGLFGSIFQRCFARHETAVNLVMALLLVYCAWSISGFDFSFLKYCFP